MMNNLSDIELLNELSIRLQKNQEDMDSKNRLLKDLENLNSKLIQSEKVKSEFLSNIRNEINNPLSSILGLSSLLLSGSDNLTEDVSRKVQLIHEESLKLNFQLRNIFTAAEIEAGKLNIEISRINLFELVSNVAGNFQWQASKKQVRINILNQLSDLQTLFYHDAEKLSVILSNLISNAIEFSFSGGDVNIIVADDFIEVVDTGIGISEEDHERIFDRFVQLNSGSTKLYAGHGLGLAVVKDLSDLINSEIVLKSSLNNGSSFKLNLSSFEPNDLMGDSMDGNEFLFSNNDDEILF